MMYSALLLLCERLEVCNIADAAGKVSPAEASHHYAIARGSAMEIGAS
jgi:hypothetical protein